MLFDGKLTTLISGVVHNFFCRDVTESDILLKVKNDCECERFTAESMYRATLTDCSEKRQCVSNLVSNHAAFWGVHSNAWVISIED